jgi:hypothetical protein
MSNFVAHPGGIINRTKRVPGLHFQDHEEMQGYWLPEWSHMTGSEADRFTAAFHGLVQRELAAREADGGNP